MSDVGEQLADRIADGLDLRALRPAIMFWTGGLVAWASERGWAAALAAVEPLDTTAETVAAVLVTLLVLVCSAGLLAWVRLPILRAMEGYWPAPLSWLRHRRVARLNRRLAREAEELEMLEGDLGAGILRGERLARYGRLSLKHAQYPIDPNLRMPTMLGNYMRAAEEHPFQHYGLEAVTVWPRLWLVLPEQARREVQSARAQLDRSAETVGWGLLFTLFSAWAWWAAPAGLAVAAVGYGRALHDARLYAAVLRSCFDLHRFELYRSLRWPLPATQEREWAEGERLTSHLLRNGSRPAFEHAAEPRAVASEEEV